MKKRELGTRFMVCVNNAEYPASLEMWKIYRTIPDTSAAKQQLVRIIDESGEDYLYPASYFASIRLPQVLAKAYAVAN